MSGSELEALRAWKAEAIEVLCRWDNAWEALGAPGRLGDGKPESLVNMASRLRPLMDEAADWVDAIEANIGNHCAIMSVSAQGDLVRLLRGLRDLAEAEGRDR